MDRARALRRVGLLAPTAIIAAVPVAALVITEWTWALVVAVAISVITVAAGVVIALQGLSPAARAAYAAGALAVSVAVVYLLVFVTWPLMATSEGLVSQGAMYAYVLGPWLVLVAGATAVRRAGRQKGAPPIIPWWIASLAACMLAYPLVGWTTTVSNADDMAALVLLFIPAFALGLWAGPLAVVAWLARSAANVHSEEAAA